MAVDVAPLPNGAGARILGADLAKPLGDGDFARIRDAFLEWTNILIPGQDHISPADYEAFCGRFGEIIPGIPATGRHKQYSERDVRRVEAPKYTLPGHGNIFVITNEEADGKPAGLAKAGLYWHSDLYYRDTPAKVTFLLAKQMPKRGGTTCIMNMYRVYEAMPEDLRRRLDGLTVWHSWVTGWPYTFPTRAPLSDEEVADTPDVVHPLVCRHGDTARPTLYIGAFYSVDNPGIAIRGLPAAEARELYEELKAFALRPEFIYEHLWQVGDLLATDDIAAMHAATPFDDTGEVRRLLRITIQGAAPIAA